MKIYVVTHKPYNLPKVDDCYQLFSVGKIIEGIDLYDAMDEDNISNLNYCYCELTCLYWMWKHSKEDIVGLAHYRRFFSDDFGNIRNEKYYFDTLKKYDLIVSNKIVAREGNVFDGLINEGNVFESDLIILREVIKEKFPEYLELYDRILNSNETNLYNMFVGKKHVVDSYCEWLFSILFEYQKRVDLTGYTVNQKRLFGFVAERLFGCWIEFNKINYTSALVTNTEETKITFFGKNIKNCIRKIIRK